MNRRGFTLIEMAMAVGIGLSVAIAAFAAVDATAKTISGAKRQALEDDLLAQAARWLRQEPAASTIATGMFHTAVLGVGADWPDHWPRLHIAGVGAEVVHNNGAKTRTWAFTLTDADGVTVRNRVLLPITRLP